MPFLSRKALRTSSRLVLVVSVCLIFTRGNVYAFSLLSWVPSEGSFALGQWQGGVVGGYEWEDQQTSSAGGSPISVMRNRFDEDVHLRNNGFYLLDPRLLEASAGVDFDFFQEYDKFAGASKHASGTLIGWDVNTTVLGEKPYTGILFSHRNEAVSSTDFGGRTDSVNQNFGMTAILRQYSFLREALPYLYADLYAREEEADQSTTQLGQTFKLNETRDVAGVDAYKGFQTADLDFNYQFLNDRYTGSTRYNFSTNWASLNYSLDFGPTLNRRWDSRVNYLTRSGGGVNESYLYADERLHIDHFENLSTNYEYLLIDTETQGQRDTSNTGTFQLQHRLYRSLVNTLTLQGFYETLSQGHRDFCAVDLSPNYNRSIPWDGTLFLDSDARYEIDQDHITGPIPVIDEQHTAPTFFGPGIGFTLNNPFVVTSTIVMFDTRGGARIATTAGVDYVIVPQGQLTQIVILPTTVVILPGDPLAVSYSYVVAPNGRYSTTTWSADAGVTFGWMAFHFGHQQLNQSLQSGQGGQFLYNMRQESVHLDLHRDWDWVDVRTSALYQIYHSQSRTFLLDYTLQNYGEYLTFRPGWSTVLHLDGNEMFTSYTHPTRHNSSLNFQTSLDRFLPSGDYFTLFARVRQVNDSLFPTETDYEAGLRGDFRYGKIFIRPWFSWINRTWGTVKTNDPHLMLKIGRDL